MAHEVESQIGSGQKVRHRSRGIKVLTRCISTQNPSGPLFQLPSGITLSAYFGQVVRRIAAILLLGPALDASYQAILPTAGGLPGR